MQAHPVIELSYEAAFSELENIVATLEADKHPLDESLALYERGQELARYCTALLDKADLRVRQLSGDTTVEFNEHN